MGAYTARVRLLELYQTLPPVFKSPTWARMDTVSLGQQILLAKRKELGISVVVIPSRVVAPHSEPLNYIGQAELERRKADLGYLQPTPLSSPQNIVIIPSPYCDPIEEFKRIYGADIKIYPSLAAYCLDYSAEIILQSPLRLYLLVRHIDIDGRGWVDQQQLKEIFTTDKYGARLYGWRRMKQVFEQGDGLFWKRRKGKDGRWRIFYRKVSKVMYELDIERAASDVVTIPVTGLLANGRSAQATANAHIYAGQLVGRNHSDKPIARRKLQKATGLSPRRQRSSQQRLGDVVEVKKNVEIHHNADIEELAWQGKRPFLFTDKYGLISAKKYETYVATMLPQSYIVNDANYQPVGTNHRKRINSNLKGLRIMDGVANGSGEEDPKYVKLFHDNGNEAAKAANRNDRETPAYYKRSLQLEKLRHYVPIGAAVWQNARAT